jgi:hypothetical protein
MESVYLIVALGAAVAGFVQGLSGFAFGMVAMSFWAWVLEPRLAATLAVFGALTGQILAALTVRRGFQSPTAAALHHRRPDGHSDRCAAAAALGHARVQGHLGQLLVLWCPVMLLSKHLPTVSAGGAWPMAPWVWLVA